MRSSPPRHAGLARFRLKLWLAMMVVVSAVTVLGLLFAQRNAAATVKRDFQRQFEGELGSLHAVQEIRHAVLAERCRALARRPRIHAALEDNALDLLYPSARDELADMMGGNDRASAEAPGYALHARFYRFLDSRGAVLEPPDPRDAGVLGAGDESRLALPAVPDQPQTGYLWRMTDAGGTIDEVIAMPIPSTETGEVIAAIVLGFRPSELNGPGAAPGIRSGIWLGGRLGLPSVGESARAQLAGEVARAVARKADNSIEVLADGAPYLLFYKLLNPGSPFPPACEVCIYPLSGLLARQRHLVWQFAGAGALLILGAFGASYLLSNRLSAPVERSARFSADASHQLKTPVTVLRAGLEELLATENFSPETREEVSALVHQTFRLTNVIEDLLLLSRLDAGRLKINFRSVDLARLIEGWRDDFGALPDDPDLALQVDLPPSLPIAGEKRYVSLVLQNLLENARKYNRPGGRIGVSARSEGGWAVLVIGNSGKPIPPAAQEHVFERFHRGAVGENIPGHGLGLNLARELARLHGGELRLVRSEGDWTEFEVRFRLAPPGAADSRA